jgi:hypothetical protein
MVDKWLLIGLSLCADAGCDFPIYALGLSLLFLFVLRPLPALFGGEKNFHFGSCSSLEYLSLTQMNHDFFFKENSNTAVFLLVNIFAKV